MWPFAKRGPRLVVEEAMQKHKHDFDFAPFQYNNASIKLWLPDKIITSIDVLSLSHEVSRPDVLRWILFEHAYGRELFAGLCVYSEELKAIEQTVQFSRKQTHSDISFRLKEDETPRAVNQRFLGKATEDFKLWLPSPLKESLQELAVIKSAELSDYLRGMLFRHLFGERIYNEWQQALAEINQQAIQHEKPIYVEGQ